MPIVQRHISPDGLLQLVVDHDDTGDWTVGFAAGEPNEGEREAFRWHTHGDLLDAPMWGYIGSTEERVRAFVDDVICSRRSIIVWIRDGQYTDAWVDDDWSASEQLDEKLKYAEPGESAERRFWNGQQVLR